MKNENKIVLYTTDTDNITVDVRFEDEIFWLTQKAMGELFDIESNTITYYLQEIYKSGELDENATTRKFRAVQKEGTLYINTENRRISFLICGGFLFVLNFHVLPFVRIKTTLTEKHKCYTFARK